MRGGPGAAGRGKGCVCPAPGRRGEEDGDGARRPGGERRGAERRDPAAPSAPLAPPGGCGRRCCGRAAVRGGCPAPRAEVSGPMAGGGEGAAPLWPEGAVRGAAEGRGRLRWGRSAGLAASCPRPSQPPSSGSGPCLYKESESGSERQGNESAVLPGETGRAGCAGGGAARVGGGAVGATALGAGSWALLLFRLAVASSAFDLFECSGRPGGVTRGCVWGGVLCLGRAGVQRGGSSPWGRLRDQRRRRGVPSRRAICEWRGRDSPRSGTAFYVTD